MSLTAMPRQLTAPIVVWKQRAMWKWSDQRKLLALTQTTPSIARIWRQVPASRQLALREDLCTTLIATSKQPVAQNPALLRVEEQSVLLVGPATAVCTTNPTCRTLTEELIPSRDNATGAFLFDIEFGIEARCAGSCETTESVEIAGLARAQCPLGSDGCYNGDGIFVVNVTDNTVTFSVSEAQVYRCDKNCKVLEGSQDVQGPAKVACPTSSTFVDICTGSHSSTTSEGTKTYSIGDDKVQCSELCTINEQSIEIKAPFEATCPSDGVGCSPSSSSSQDGSTTTYSASTEGDYRCGNRCSIEASVIVHGPAEIKCGSDTVNCLDIGGVFNADGSSQHSLDCGKSGLCSQSCTVDGGGVGSPETSGVKTPKELCVVSLVLLIGVVLL